MGGKGFGEVLGVEMRGAGLGLDDSSAFVVSAKECIPAEGNRDIFTDSGEQTEAYELLFFPSHLPAAV